MNTKLSIKTFDPMEVIVNSSGTIVYVIDLSTYEVLYANDRCIEEFGEVVGTTCYNSLQKNQDTPCSFCPIQQSENPLSHPIGTIFEWENQNSINNRHYLFNDRVIRWKNGQLAKIQVGIDITKQKILEQAILKERDDAIRSFEALTDSTIEGLIIYDDQKRCIRVNKVAPKLFGYTDQEMIGLRALDFIAPESIELVAQMLQNDDQEPYEAKMIRRDGTIFPAMLRGRNQVLNGKNIRVSAVMDISSIKEKEAEILKLAHYDILTALPNRLLLREYLHRIIQQSSKTGYFNALLFIDLDNFKTINDTKGHSAGDMVLVETANRISSVIRQRDMVSRQGGDEFIVLIDTRETDKEVAVNHASTVAKKILAELQKPYLLSEHDFRLSASIGIALFSDNEHSIDDLMKYADSAMYNAKSNGRNTFNFFDPKLQQMIERKALMIERLRKAIEKNAMTLYYQPQIREQNIIGVEALIRWYDPKEGMISPGKFIPIAEESGLIVQLGEWVIREAVRQLTIWKSDPIKSTWRISVNVSYKQFEQQNFVSMVESLIHEHDINPQKLRLELTESLLIKNTQEALDKINHLKKIGLSLSIDDFGTGYSSLSYLKQLPIDELKIDQSFIRDLTKDINDVIIVETILSIGQKFGFEVIAEGVETAEQYEQLISMGCEYFQGYLFGKPTVPMFL